MISQYDAEIAQVDEQFQLLLDAMKSDAGHRKLVVALSADHGESLGEGGRFFHGNAPFESESRIPLIFWGPGIVPNDKTIDVPASHTDVMPTLIAAAGLPIPKDLDGINLLQPAEKLNSVKRLLVGAGSYGENENGITFAIRSESGKLMADWQDGAVVRYRYFDFRKDKDEISNNFAADGNQHGPLVSMAEAIARRMSERTAESPTSSSPTLDKETIRQLKALGYLQ